jgi:hypothetical protein
MLSKRSGYVCAIALISFLPCDSQLSTRPVGGAVTDKRGNTLAGASVLLENTADLSVRSYITQQDGRFHFNGLNTDVDFTLKAHYKRWWSPSKTLSKFNESKNPEVTLVIPVE